MAGTARRPSRHLTISLLLVATLLWPAAPARAEIISPKNGHTYVIGPDESYTTAQLDWKYSLPDPRCTENYAAVYYYETWPDGHEQPNGGGTQNGPHSYADLDWPTPGNYKGRTAWTCTIDGPPLGHPSGDYNVFDQPLDTISYQVRKWGENVPAAQGVAAAYLGPYLTLKEVPVPVACLKGDEDCFALGELIIEAVRLRITLGLNRAATPARQSKWVTIGQSDFSLARQSEATVSVPLSRKARKALKQKGKLKVRVTVRASIEGGPTETVRRKAKLKYAKPNNRTSPVYW